MLPCGIMVGAAGPYQGSMHDSRMLEESGFRAQFAASMQRFHEPGKQPWEHEFWPVCAADVAYASSEHLLRPFKNAYLTEEQLVFNACLTRGRICVEWGFGVVKTVWKHLAMGPYALKLAQNPVPAISQTAFILTNAHCCLYGNEVSLYYGVTPPTLREYFS